MSKVVAAPFIPTVVYGYRACAVIADDIVRISPVLSFRLVIELFLPALIASVRSRIAKVAGGKNIIIRSKLKELRWTLEYRGFELLHAF
ncbi:hypothetical protein [Paraburkholderia gardini]|uniref:hypothetical protein n=1 Tax=Paraburkholderia gardini TaxID=2823469 RepID=UPI001E5EA09A|nr:hypothetical protein [Paraburkholderia gardini]